jgi:hypothetical protein
MNLNPSMTDLGLAREQWQQLQSALAQLRAETLAVAAFSALAQEQHSLRSALPARFDEVLMQLLNRLESSALFTEESCSFSRQDLLGSLQMWLDKAALRLAPA